MGGLPTGLPLFAGAPNFASTAAMVDPRCGVSTPVALTETWPSMANVSLKAGAARAKATAITDNFNVASKHGFLLTIGDSTVAAIYPPLWQSQPLSPAPDYV